MYTPSHFHEDNSDKLFEFIRAYPFGLLITVSEASPVASPIPMELHRVHDSDPFRIFGHLAAPNPQSAHLAGRALAVFTGPNAYISSSWYNHPNVSTWNYMSVQVEGEITVLGDEDCSAHLQRMQKGFETGQAKPFHTDKLPEGLFEKYLRGVVGFSIRIDRLLGSWKLSQNRSREDHSAIIRQLEARGDDGAKQVADVMRSMGKHKRK